MARGINETLHNTHIKAVKISAVKSLPKESKVDLNFTKKLNITSDFAETVLQRDSILELRSANENRTSIRDKTNVK